MSESSYSQPGVTVTLILDDGEWRRATTTDGQIANYDGDFTLIVGPETYHGDDDVDEGDDGDA